MQQDFYNQVMPFLDRLDFLIRKNIYKGEASAKVLLREDTLLTHLDFITKPLEEEIVVYMRFHQTGMQFEQDFKEARQGLHQAMQLLIEQRKLAERLSPPRPMTTEAPASPETTARNRARLNSIFMNVNSRLDMIQEDIKDRLDMIQEDIEDHIEDQVKKT